ncbi:hypothetical protein BJX64DRAFT_297358 [Aspergillus heterothallicus]
MIPFSIASPFPIPRSQTNTATPPVPEPVSVIELPLPPVAPSNDIGACTKAINRRGTGCIGKTAELRNGNFLPDNKHIVATVTFAGAPAGPNPASIYTGEQLIVIKTDGKKFANGDAWKCITCGIPEANRNGTTSLLEYPQAFKDGRRVLAGNNIIDCGALLSSTKCNPKNAHIYPIHWTTSADGSGPSGAIRENRIHPDNVHMGFSSFTTTGGVMGQFAYFGRLAFNPSPTTGTPQVPRYELVNVTRLYDPAAPPVVSISGTELKINNEALSVGELRGFSGSGDEITYVGSNWESSNIDLFAADLATGRVRRITQHPGYADPIDISPDDEWSVVLDTRSTNRTMFMAGMRHIPPLTDLVSSSASASIRNNGQRRFFQPWLLDRAGDRSEYFGQQLNGHGDGGPGSVNDPQWNAQADPRWSWDGTKITYYQTLTVPPQCGGANPLPCPVSTADSGRTYRIMLAMLTSRKPIKPRVVKPVSDVVPWGVPYVAGEPTPVRWYPPAGVYKVYGEVSGYADVTLVENRAGNGLETVAVQYLDYSGNTGVVLHGSENVTVVSESLTLERIAWYSNISSSGDHVSSKVTNDGGFHLLIDLMETEFVATGTLTTTVDGVVYEQPENYT